MKYAIVESGGKQYRAVEGGTLEVDRLPVEPGANVKLEQILLLADGENITVGTPVIKDNPVWANVVEHFKGKKVTIFNYSPKKRIRVKTGHRQNYTRLLVKQIGGSELAKEQPVEKVETVLEAEAEQPKAKAVKAEPKAETASRKAKAAKAEKVSTKPAAKASARTKATSSPKEKKPAASAKKPAAPASKKTTAKAEPKKKTTKAAPTSSPKGTSFPKGKKPAEK